MRPVKGMELGGIFINPRYNGCSLLISLRIGNRKRKNEQNIAFGRRLWISKPPLSYLKSEKDAWLGDMVLVRLLMLSGRQAAAELDQIPQFVGRSFFVSSGPFFCEFHFL
jgi:hypothetical protein